MWLCAWLVFGIFAVDLSIQVDQISKIDCDFEDASSCGYTAESSHSGVSFVRQTGMSASRLSSTSNGITSSSQGSWYTYLRCNSGTNYHYASLISPEEQAVFKKCLRFSYNMHGSNVFVLKVFMKTLLGWGDAIWRQHSNHGPNWETAIFPITSFQPFQIVFQAHAGIAPKCDIGVDDVKIIDCPDTVLDDPNTYEAWTQWKKCDQSCGAYYTSRARFWFSRERKQAYDFTYHIRYKTVDKQCPEESRWYLDDLKDGQFNDEYGTASATVMSGTMNNNDRLLAVKTGQESVKVTFPYDSCIFGVKECPDGFTLAYWINLQSSAGGWSILSPDNSTGLKITLADAQTANITMDVNGKQWSMNVSVVTNTWTYVTVTWSSCHGLTYYEDGHVKEHVGVFKTILGDSGLEEVGEKSFFIGKTGSADGAIFSMLELVLWNGMISPADIKALYLKVDQTERFMLLKHGDERTLQWKESYTGTPSNDTGPIFTYLRSEFDIEDEDYKPTSCEDIKLMGQGDVDAYYVIFPRGACGDSVKVWCFGMSTLTPREYIDVDPALNVAVFAGLDAPCLKLLIFRGKSSFNKVRVLPDTMVVDISDGNFATVSGTLVQFATGGACYSGSYHATCTHSGYFNVNLMNTPVRVKPTVNWRGTGYWVSSDFSKMVNFKRSPDSREFSANCGGYCGHCKPDGDLTLELVSCVKKKPSSCADVKYYMNSSRDGNYTIYPYAVRQLPVRVYCARMNTAEPKEYINVLQGVDKNFALLSGDFSVYSNSWTCNLDPGVVTATYFADDVGHTKFSKIRLDVKTMEVLRGDDSFGHTLFRSSVNYGLAGDCYSKALCMPRGFFNIDLSGTGLRVRPDVTWTRSLWPARHKVLLTIHEDLYSQVIDANCGGWCGTCSPSGQLYLEVVVPHTHSFFGGKKLSLIDSSDHAKSKRNLDLSNVWSESAGLASRDRIPDSSFSASSAHPSPYNEACDARVMFGNFIWRAHDTDVRPWLQVDLLFVRLVTALATHGASSKYPKSYSVSFGFEGDQLMAYLDVSKQRKIFVRNTEGPTIVKEVLIKPFFARHVRFSVLSWHVRTKMAVEIYVCPRATYHHMVLSGNFYYLESSYPVRKGDRGELVTRTMPPVYTCARFKYHMSGSAMGRIEVYVEEVVGVRRLLWSLAGEQSQHAWKKAAIPLQVTTAFKVIFVGVVGDSYTSDVAIGAVSLANDSNCTITPSHARSACVPACVGRSKCDNVTGKCVCLDKDFVGEKCENKLLNTIYKDAFHYWSFDDPENVTDLKSGVQATGVRAGVSREYGPVNLAMKTNPEDSSGLRLGEITYPCLRDMSLCHEGLTVSAWIKPSDPKNRESYFNTNPGGTRLGIAILTFADSSELSCLVQGTKHKCSLRFSLPSFRIWIFVSVTWTLQLDGSGRLVFYLIHATGFHKNERICPEMTLSMIPNLGRMEVVLQQSYSNSGFSVDELAVWNATLTEDRIIAMYNLVTGNFSNFISWNFELKSYSWSRALVDTEDFHHSNAVVELNSVIGDYLNDTSVKRIWEEYESDECIYVGSVRNGAATWREGVILHCNDSRLQRKNEDFNLKLHVKNAGVDVDLNNVKLGSVSTQGQNIARGGFFGTFEPNDVLVKGFNVETNTEQADFTYDNCDMTYSGPTGEHGQYRLRGTEIAGVTSHCMAIYNRPILSRRYRIEAQFRHDRSNSLGYSHMGLFFNYENGNNFVFFIIRCYEWAGYCFSFQNHGTGESIHGDCTAGIPKMQVWHSLIVYVEPEEIQAYLDGSLLVKTGQTFIPQSLKVGALVYYRHEITASFKDFRVEEYFTPISSFPNTNDFQVPRIQEMSDSDEVKSVLGHQVSSDQSYAVSADFHDAVGAFGLCYNVVDENNFNFVYYRRKRVLFAEVLQSMSKLSWKQNEIIQKGVENSSFLLISRSSRKVPTHVPYNVSSTALNSTALNISWYWSPDHDVTGVFQGFKILYRKMEDSVESWEEKIVYGQEFQNHSWVILDRLRKSTEYYLKIVAFSLVGEGWPSAEILNSTLDDIPDIIDLNVTVQNIDLKSVLVHWDLLPELYWNAPEPSYIVLFADIVRGVNISVEVPPGTTELNYTQLKHFTNYTVSLNALNHVGASLPAVAALIETLEYVPEVYPSNVAVTVLNTSALTVSWNHIDGDSWQGMPLGYVIYCNHSDDQRNFTVTSSTELMITNLTAFTFYDVTIAGYTRYGTGAKHPVITARTHEEVPLIAPVSLRIRNPASNEVPGNTNTSDSVPTSYSTIFEWDPVPAEQVRGVIRGYTVSYKPVEVFYITRARRSVLDDMHVVNTSSTSVKLEDLLFYTNYSAQVLAYTVGNGVPSSEFHFLTPEGVPSEGPRDLQANNEGLKWKLFVKWDDIPVHSRNGILLGYHIYHRKSGSSGTTKNVSVTASNVVLTGLETYTLYDVRVCGFTSVGDGVCSEVTARTRSYDSAPYTAPWNATIALTSPLSISLVWEPFPDSLWYDYPRGYHITFQRVALGGIRTSGDNITIVRVGYKTASYSWNNLQYYTRYKVEISTFTYRGYGPRVVLYGETCDCPAVMTSTFQILPPYVLRKPDGKVGGIIPELIERMTSSCCTTCPTSMVTFDKDGLGEISEQETYPDLLSSIHESTTFTFPMMGYPSSKTYSSHFGFIPGVEAPGMIVMVKKQSAASISLTVLKSVFGLWPILMVNILLALIAGIVMWMLDSSANEEIFPRTCLRGVATGFWWAFVSMTTVGYGDTTAKSVPGRIFAVIWILTGLCLYSILIGDLSSSLSATVSVSKTMLYGAKVAVLVNSTEESVAIQRAAKVVGGPYHKLREIQEALLTGKVDAAILDIWTAGLTKELWNHTDLRMSQKLTNTAPYGIVISGGLEGTQACFERYVGNNRIKTLQLVTNYTATLKGIRKEEATEYVQDLINGQSKMFRHTLLVLCLSYGMFILLGVIWNFSCRRRRPIKRKKDNSVSPQERADEEMVKDLSTTSRDISRRLQEMKTRHLGQLRRFVLAQGV